MIGYSLELESQAVGSVRLGNSPRLLNVFGDAGADVLYSGDHFAGELTEVVETMSAALSDAVERLREGRRRDDSPCECHIKRLPSKNKSCQSTEIHANDCRTHFLF